MSRIYLDPTGEVGDVKTPRVQGLQRLAGRIGLVDISKPRGDVFLAELGRLLEERNDDVTVRVYRKPTFTKPAPPDLVRRVAEECDAVVLALAD